MEVVACEPASSNADTPVDPNNNVESWSTRDQLMLISFAIVNGDSNWSHVSDQMNKAGLRKKTSAQCSKQYRQIIKDFMSNKNQLIDLKKIYSQIAEQRLDEVNAQVKSLKDQYWLTASKISDLIDLELSECDQLIPLSHKLKHLIAQWICLNLKVDTNLNLNSKQYNQDLIEKLKQIDTNKELTDELVDLLQQDGDYLRLEDERSRLAQEEQRVQKLKQQQQQEQQEQEMERKRLEEEREKDEAKTIDVKIESQPDVEDENSKDSSARFSSEDDMPLLNIVKSKGLLVDHKTKSPSPSHSQSLPSEHVRRSLRKAKGEQASSPSSSTMSTISHKSVSLPCSSLSEDKEHKHQVKASPSNTSSVYDNLDADDQNQDVYKSKKKNSETKKEDDEPDIENALVTNLVSIKQEPKDSSGSGGGTGTGTGIDMTAESSKAANISGSSLSSVSSSKTSEEERSHRAWKKSIMMILNNIACHKHATIFMHPVKDDIAPGYSTLIHRPIDLSTIKKNLESGSTRTTKEFQRDTMLMFTNALMYNSTNHNIHRIALEMFKEVLADIEQLLNAQEALCSNESMDSTSYAISKPLRYKEMRSSSTNSDGKSSSIFDESLAGLLVKKGRPLKDTKSSSKSSLKDESVNNDCGSIKSNSSVSTPRNSTTRSRVSTKLGQQQQKSPKQTPAKKEDAGSNVKKRKPSVSNSSTNLNATSIEHAKDTKDDQAPKSKRRKSGR